VGETLPWNAEPVGRAHISGRQHHVLALVFVLSCTGFRPEPQLDFVHFVVVGCERAG
jgi:hypothetical protein